MILRGIEPTPIFSPGFYTFSSVFPSVNTGVPYKEIWVKTTKLRALYFFKHNFINNKNSLITLTTDKTKRMFKKVQRI